MSTFNLWFSSSSPIIQRPCQFNWLIYSSGIFKFLDEYYDSLRREAQKKEEEENLANGSSGSGPGTGNEVHETQHGNSSHSEDVAKKK